MQETHSENGPEGRKKKKKKGVRQQRGAGGAASDGLAGRARETGGARDRQ